MDYSSMSAGEEEAQRPLPAYLRAFYILALGSLVILILRLGANLLIPLTVAALLSMLLAPVTGWLERKHLGRLAGAALPVLCMIVFLFILSGLAIRQITLIGASLAGATERLNASIERLDTFLRWHLALEESPMPDLTGERMIQFLREYSGELFGFMGGIAGPAFGGILVPAFTFFLLFYRHHLQEFSVRLFLRSPTHVVKHRTEELRAVAQKYLVGLITVAAILSVLNATALSLIGVEHAIFFGVFAGMLNIVPFFGPFFGAVFPVLYVFLMRDGLAYPLLVIAAFIFIQLIESYFLTPKIIGRNVNLNPLVIFVGLLAGALIWGVMGMVIVIPALSIAMQLFKLSPTTEPFAFLLGPPRKNPKTNAPKKDTPLPAPPTPASGSGQRAEAATP
ncbi:MAG: AI-2E family transporter [Opitutales bacterium]|nr:AI-2E family transporter [Opitutales bacterium]